MKPLKSKLLKSTTLYDLFEEDHLFSGHAAALDDHPTDQEVIDFINANQDNVVTIKSAYNKAGVRIGNDQDAEELCDRRGIFPENQKDWSVCNFGKSTDGKWYGWSHRAIFGFTVGSTCEKGNCHYLPKNEQDAIESAIRFWSEPDHLNIRAGEVTTDDHGRKGVVVTWDYADTVPNEKLHGQIGSAFCDFPDEWGKGEWTAETEEDARQMAIDFANSVS